MKCPLTIYLSNTLHFKALSVEAEIINLAFHLTY